MVTVLHIGLVAAVPFLPQGFCHTHIELVGLALLHHGGLVLDLVVKAPGAVHGAVDGPPSAIAVLVARQLIGELPRQLEIIANNAAKTLFGRKICQKKLVILQNLQKNDKK